MQACQCDGVSCCQAFGPTLLVPRVTRVPRAYLFRRPHARFTNVGSTECPAYLHARTRSTRIGPRSFQWVHDSFARLANPKFAGCALVSRVLPGPTAQKSAAQAAGLGNLANTAEPWRILCPRGGLGVWTAGFPRVHRVLPEPTARQSSAQAAGLGNLANTAEPWKGGTSRAHSQMDRSSKATPFLDKSARNSSWKATGLSGLGQ
jgi:hypothetical protein